MYSTSYKSSPSLHSIETTPSLFSSHSSAPSSPESSVSSIFELPASQSGLQAGLQSPFKSPVASFPSMTHKTPSLKKKLTSKFHTLNQSFSTENLLRRSKSSTSRGKQLLPAIELKSKKNRNNNVFYFKNDETKILKESYYKSMQNDELDFFYNDEGSNSDCKNSRYDGMKCVDDCFQNEEFITQLLETINSNSTFDLSDIHIIIKEQSQNLSKLFPKILNRLSYFSELKEIVGNEIRKIIRLNYNELNAFNISNSSAENSDDKFASTFSLFWSCIIELISYIFQNSFEENFKLKITWFKFINYLNDLFINQWNENYNEFDSDYLSSLQQPEYTFEDFMSMNEKLSSPATIIEKQESFNSQKFHEEVEFENNLDDLEFQNNEASYDDLNSVSSLNTINIDNLDNDEIKDLNFIDLETKFSNFSLDLDFNDFEIDIGF